MFLDEIETTQLPLPEAITHISNTQQPGADFPPAAQLLLSVLLLTPAGWFGEGSSFHSISTISFDSNSIHSQLNLLSILISGILILILIIS